ncbi:MAG: protein kinase [Myxococcales bacterium]|nr:protein kinase [Myxococcales bacterium]
MLQAGTLQGKTLGKYRIDSLLGDGGQAVVYKAWHKDFESWVALKFLQERIAQKSALRERFKREARLQFKLQHPHIIRVIEIIEEDDLLGMAMDWIEGPDLEHYLAKRGGPLSNEELARIFLPVLSAVDTPIKQRHPPRSQTLQHLVGGSLVKRSQSDGLWDRQKPRRRKSQHQNKLCVGDPTLHRTRTSDFNQTCRSSRRYLRAWHHAVSTRFRAPPFEGREMLQILAHT